jgi:hypothetical protein
MEYSLDKGKAMSLSTGHGKYSLKVCEGVVWLTCPDDSRDYFLEKGERFDTRTVGKFVMEAMTDSVIVIECKNTDTALQLMIQVNLQPSWKLPVTMGSINRPC